MLTQSKKLIYSQIKAIGLKDIIKTIIMNELQASFQKVLISLGCTKTVAFIIIMLL